MKYREKHMIHKIFRGLWLQRALVALVAVLALVACGLPSAVADLDAADSLMERRPDSALALLRQVDTLRLTSAHDRARYAMLLSMALDKNYIDLKDFRVLQPALDYYERHGTPTEQLRTFYYQGRIYDNAGYMSKALQTYLKALERGEQSGDVYTKARACFAQIEPYMELNAFDQAIAAARQALAYYRRTGRVDSEAHCLTDLANIYTLRKEADSAWNCLKACRALWPQLSAVRKQDFYNHYLIATYAFCGTDSVRQALEAYKAHVPPARWDSLTLAYAYIQVRDFDRARFLIDHYRQLPAADRDSRFYSILYHFYTGQGLYREANAAYLHFNELNDSINRLSLRENARLAEGQHQLKLAVSKSQQARQRNFWIAACSLCVLLLVVCGAYYGLRMSRMRRQLAEQERERYRLQYELLRDEYGSLQQLLADNNRLDASARHIVRKRLALLNEFFKAHITEDGCAPEKRVLQILADREAFMRSTREGFAVSHPGFIRHLEQKGLTEWEVGYCCLFALGLNGKEVGRYTHFGNHYKINIHIRRKLGLDSHSTNLNLYITRLLRESEEQTAYDIYPNN